MKPSNLTQLIEIATVEERSMIIFDTMLADTTPAYVKELETVFKHPFVGYKQGESTIVAYDVAFQSAVDYRVSVVLDRYNMYLLPVKTKHTDFLLDSIDKMDYIIMLAIKIKRHKVLGDVKDIDLARAELKVALNDCR